MKKKKKKKCKKKKKVLKINLLTLSIKKRDFMKRVETHLEISLPHCYPFFFSISPPPAPHSNFPESYHQIGHNYLHHPAVSTPHEKLSITNKQQVLGERGLHVVLLHNIPTLASPGQVVVSLPYLGLGHVGNKLGEEVPYECICHPRVGPLGCLES